ncbi:MAG: bifunctional UDP-N-acetylglucosamine diphosphorylase/glucosamine-1-phosphate N-acetyltransferase GlmU [Bordetella sp.]|nr:MAG: bifunctional UDP-N-acetylglucosamine diphosphorylase/glucosamine-1-phosphate N-acetyltransferase GlmU [Bordetella sp.]
MLNIIIIAAGIGKRMNSNIPKSLHKLAGRYFLDHILESAEALKPSSINIVVGYGAEQIKSIYKHKTYINFIIQKNQMGTGHAVQQAIQYLSEKESKENLTLILYGDVPLIKIETLKILINNCSEGIAILTNMINDSRGYGHIIRDKDDRVLDIIEDEDSSEIQHKIQEINTGILVASTPKLKYWLSQLNNNNKKREYYLTDIIPLAIKDDVFINTYKLNSNWEGLGVNTKIQQVQLERLWQKQQAYNQIKKGVTIIDPERFDLRGKLYCGQEVFIDINCIFEGDVHLGDNTYIGPNCILKNVHVESGSIVDAYSHLQEAYLCKDVRVGPFSRLRPKVELGQKSCIGSFVEIKNSKIGDRTKTNHLSYIGDAYIGNDVNIGAGTITCNYDGINKSNTIIEDKAFIGSNSQLIAPIRVGQNATIAAGTVLTKDAPREQLTIARTKQISIKNWNKLRKKHTN